MGQIENPDGRWTGTVLLVEDEEPLRKLLSSYLRRRGYLVETAGSAEEALEMAPHFDILVSDIMLPGQTGVVLARTLAQTRENFRVVFITGYADVEIDLDLPEDHWLLLPKPFELSALERAISRISQTLPHN